MKPRHRLLIYIIRIIISTPLIATAKLYENLQQSSTTTALPNYLGKLTIIHYPRYWRFHTYHGMSITYGSAENKPEYHYYYPET